MISTKYRVVWLLMLLLVGCSPSINLPMPHDIADWQAFDKHFNDCVACNTEDPSGGPGAMCEAGFRLLIEAMKAESPLWRVSPVDGYHYRGPEIEGWQWSVARQEWQNT